MAGTWDRPHYTNVQMPFAGLPPHVPSPNPTGVYEREFELPAGWDRRRVVLHVGAAESVLIVTLNGEEIGVGKDSHLASEFDVTSRVHRGPNTLRLTVVKWSDATYVEDQDQWWHGGISRPVFLYTTGHAYLAVVKAVGGLADDFSTGTLDVQAVVAFAGQEPEPGWTIEASIEGQTAGAEAPLAAGPDWPVDPADRRGGRILVARAGSAPGAAAGGQRPPGVPAAEGRRLVGRATRAS
jgi:beta-galactosidase